MLAFRRSCLLAVALAGFVVLATTGPAAAATDFTLTGTVGGLYPGFQGTLPVTVTNPLAVAIRVTIVGGDVTATDAEPGCDAALLTLTSTNTSVMLQPSETVDVPVVLQLDSTAPDACQGAMFTIALHALADAGDLAVAPGAPVATPEPAALAFTGADSIAIVAIALTLVAAGMFLHSRGRRTTR